MTGLWHRLAAVADAAPDDRTGLLRMALVCVDLSRHARLEGRRRDARRLLVYGINYHRLALAQRTDERPYPS